MNESLEQIRAARLAKAEVLRARGIAPYPAGGAFSPTHHAANLHGRYGTWHNEELEAKHVEVAVAGRIVTWRSFGKSIFFHVQDRGGRIQVYGQLDALGEAQYTLLRDSVESGDWVGVRGMLFRTRTGELTVRATSLDLLSKAILPLPEKWHGLSDHETRYRQRWLDLTVNPDVQRVFLARSKIIATVREFLSARDFIEVETPMMYPIPGGATARPFITHHNALDMDLYLRIAPELYLKRLIVGGLDRVFEINRNFRNEGLSREHNPEFTMLEFYQAYASYKDLMALTEELLACIARQQSADGGTKIRFGEEELDFTPPFARVPYGTAEAKEESLRQPTFVVDFPREISPLARARDGAPLLVDRFELVVAGMEIANAFNELADPLDQAERFRAQAAARTKGDLEAMAFDANYILALEQGMPPTAGEGIGMDRVTMLFTNQQSIRDVILFPLMRLEK